MLFGLIPSPSRNDVPHKLADPLYLSYLCIAKNWYYSINMGVFYHKL